PAVRRRRRLIVAASAIVLAGMAVAGLAWRAKVRSERLAADPCAESAPLAGAWDDAARERLHAAFRDHGGVDAEEAFTHTTAALDDAAQAVLAARARTCSETRDDHTPPEAVLLVRR